jgi:tRNA(Arg) A34 adenosine deaminase TadA
VLPAHAPYVVVVHATAEDGWDALDAVWQEAFRQAWEALVTGNIGVGAVVTDDAGRIVAASRNRVRDEEAPAGELFGTSLAHAEMNALASLPFQSPRELVLTTTLQPCLQCAAAIRMAPIARVRIAGPDPLWDGAGAFSHVNSWLGRRADAPVEGPRRDEVGVFATLLARFGAGGREHVVAGLRKRGEGPLLDLAAQLREDGTIDALRDGAVADAFTSLRPELRRVADQLGSSGA